MLRDLPWKQNVPPLPYGTTNCSECYLEVYTQVELLAWHTRGHGRRAWRKRKMTRRIPETWFCTRPAGAMKLGLQLGCPRRYGPCAAVLGDFRLQLSAPGKSATMPRTFLEIYRCQTVWATTRRVSVTRIRLLQQTGHLRCRHLRALFP